MQVLTGNNVLSNEYKMFDEASIRRECWLLDVEAPSNYSPLDRAIIQEANVSRNNYD